MRDIEDIKHIYTDVKKQFTNLPLTSTHIENDLLKLIDKLCFEKTFFIFQDDKYHFEEISNLFRFYEEELKESFDENKEVFEILFKCYILIIKLFTELCTTFATIVNKRIYINDFFQLLKESKNMLKFFLPLDPKHIIVLNNLIGEHLYYFSHIQYISTRGKEIDYIFDEYYMNCEKMLHGYELSFSTNFGENELTNKDIEYSILINNVSFLLLKMIHKIAYFRGDINYFDTKSFKNVLGLFCEISLLHKCSLINTKKEFEHSLLLEFVNSANYLIKHRNHDMYTEKVDLLRLNTDEYKELIDIIMKSKNNII